MTDDLDAVDARAPVFLERGTYRRRRLRDAARLLPVLGMALWLVPVLWPVGAEGGVFSSRAIIYIFGVWGLLIVIAGLLSRRLTTDDLGGGG